MTAKSLLKYAKQPIFWAAAVAVLYAAVTMFITIHFLHDSYHTSAFDLGIFTQDLKSTLQGKILYSTAGEYQLAHHFSPVLFLLVPVYWLFPHSQMLLVVQALLLAFGGYMVYILAREYKYSHRAGLIIEGLYFLNPLVWGVALFDFHEAAFAVPALLVMFFGLKRRQWLLFSLGFIIALASKEDVVIALGVFGFVLMAGRLQRHKKVSKISVVIFSASVLTYGLGILVSHLFSAGQSPPLLSYFTNRYAYIALPLSQAVPLAFHTVFSTGSLFLIGAYLAPLALLPLFSPEWAIPALVILFSGIFSTYAGQHDELMQYPAAAIPFLFVAFMEVLPGVLANQQVKSLIQQTKNRLVPYALILIVLVSLGIISEGRIQLASFPDAHDAAINQVIALIPVDATVTASNAVFPHLCSRTDTYLEAWQGVPMSLGSGIIGGNWGIPDKNTEYVVIDYTGDPYYAAEIRAVSQNYQLIKNIDGVMLYRLDS